MVAIMMEKMVTEKIGNIDKVARYGWEIKDEPGQLRKLHKDCLQIHPAYQRDALASKIKEITANWSWVACGAIVVGERGGEFWVIDGQHRVLSAKRRSDITHLPCIVFETDGVKQEAIAFLDLNTGRKPVSSIGKFKAMLASEDAAAMIVHETLARLGVEPKATANGPGQIKSVAWMVRRAGENRERFEAVLSLAAQISTDAPIKEMLLDGLWYIDERLDGGIKQKRFTDRCRQLGASRLIDGAKRAAAYFVKGGAAVFAQGIMQEVNGGLRNKFVMEERGL